MEANLSTYQKFILVAMRRGWKLKRRVDPQTQKLIGGLMQHEGHAFPIGLGALEVLKKQKAIAKPTKGSTFYILTGNGEAIADESAQERFTVSHAQLESLSLALGQEMPQYAP